jgi:hypothetical protein
MATKQFVTKGKHAQWQDAEGLQFKFFRMV